MPLVVKFLPHEVADIEPTFEFLRAQDLRKGPWETRYMLLTWLSLMCMIPFDLRSIDSQASKDSERVCYTMGSCSNQIFIVPSVTNLDPFCFHSSLSWTR